jgi:glutathione-regulated potassium-efflux system ancillary protein KefG
MSVLVVVAHPALHRSRTNARLRQVAEDAAEVDVVDLYETYPDFDIDVPSEQDRLRAAKAIIMQHPMYWYATPALLKEWIDLVFEHGFAYGHDAEELAGKIFTQAISCGGDAEAYEHNGFTGCTVEELCKPMAATAHFCSMQYRQPFVTYGGHNICDGDIGQAAQAYGTWLNDIVTEVNGGN